MTTTTIYTDDTEADNTSLAYRTRYDDGHEETGPIDGLDDLLVVLRMGADEIVEGENNS